MRCPECDQSVTAVTVVGEIKPLTATTARERVKPAAQVFEPCGHPVPDDFDLWQTPTFSPGG